MNSQQSKAQLADLLIIAKTEKMQEAICAAFRLGQDAERTLIENLKINEVSIHEQA